MRKLRNAVSEVVSSVLLGIFLESILFMLLLSMDPITSLIEDNMILFFIIMIVMWLIAYSGAINLLEFISNRSADYLQGSFSLLVGAVNTCTVCFFINMNENITESYAKVLCLIAALLVILAARYTIRPDADLRYMSIQKNVLASVIDGVGIAAVIMIVCQADFDIKLCVELFFVSAATALAVHLLRKATTIQRINL